MKLVMLVNFSITKNMVEAPYSRKMTCIEEHSNMINLMVECNILVIMEKNILVTGNKASSMVTEYINGMMVAYIKVITVKGNEMEKEE